MLLYFAFMKMVESVIKLLFNQSFVSTEDERYFASASARSGNMPCWGRLERVHDVDGFRKTIIERCLAFPRLKSKVQKFLGRHILVEYSDEEVLAEIDTLIPVAHGIHNEKQLREFMLKELTSPFPQNGF